MKISFENLNIDRKQLFERMKNKNILLQVHYIPVHLQPYYSQKYGYSRGDFIVSENFYDREVSLPIYPGLKSSEQDYVIKCLKDCLIG